MKIHHAPCLQDNYSYLIVDESTKEGAVMNPVEPQKVLEAANSQGVNLKLSSPHIITGFLPQTQPVLHVLSVELHPLGSCWWKSKDKAIGAWNQGYGGSMDNIKGCTDRVENGHTKGHISYYVTGKEEEQPAVFTGDTLFIAGCGKFFEGTPEQMYQSLCVTLGSLPKPARVYCGHQYAVRNLQFALTIKPDNLRIQQKLTWAKNQQAGQSTIPSTIEEEMETNPFMRVDLPEIQEKVGCKSPVEALRELRKLKEAERQVEGVWN